MEGSQYNPYFDQPVYGAVVGEHNTVTINVSSLPPSSSLPPFPFRSIIGIPPPTDSRIIQQRSPLVETIFTKLNEPGLNALVLTGIGGVGKSTLAALVYRYVEEHQNTGPFTSPPLWLTIDASATFSDLVGTICQAMYKPLPSLKSLSPANQALALFNTLAMTKSSRLIVLDQFENFLNWNTGVALPKHQVISEWLNALNSQPFQTGCRLLLTSRPRPKGNREYQPLCLRECSVDGLTTAEGVDYLHKQGVQGPEAELRKVVDDCNGHALSLTLLVALLQDYQMPLTDLLVDPTRWEGDIATQLLNTIFMRLDNTQRNLLRAFSVYQIPVSIEVVLSQTEPVEQKQAFQALRALLAQHLIQAVGEGRYQPHIIVANYVKQHFVEGDEQANQRAVQQAQAKADQYQNRRRMLARVHTIWIKGVLERSLHGAALITLGMHREILANPWRLTLQQEGQAERTLPGGTGITQVYDEALGELLILGEPGSGKTTLLLELASDLLDRTMKNESLPIPVIFNLSSWALKRQPLAEWMIEELNTKYQVPRKLAKEWVSEDQILPLLDGLDEVPVVFFGQCVLAINAYREEHGIVPTVVSSRSTEYMAQKTRLRLNSVVMIQPLTMKQIDAYLESAGEQLEPVRAALREDSELQEIAATPLMLNLLTLAYYGKPVKDILAINSSETRKQQVIAAYAQRMLQRRGIKSNCTPQQTIHWLTWLARQMIQHNQTEFYIERLQPSWLSGNRMLRVYGWLAVRGPGVLMGVLLSLAINLLFFSPPFPPYVLIEMILLGGLLGGLLCGGSAAQQLTVSEGKASNVPWRRLLQRLGIGVLIGLSIGLSCRLSLGPIVGLSLGLSTGLCSILFQILLGKSNIEESPSQMPPQVGGTTWQRLIRNPGVRNGLLVGLLIGLSNGLSWGLSWGPIVGLSFGLIFGLSFGLIGGLPSALRIGRSVAVQLTDRLVWSWRSLGRSLLSKRHVSATLQVTVLCGLLLGLSGSLVGLPTEWLSVGLSLVLCYWLLLGLFGGVSGVIIEDQHRVVPNQGIRDSAFNGLVLGLVSTMIVGLSGLLSDGLEFGLIGLINGPSNGKGISIALNIALSNALSIGVIAGLSAGLLVGLLNGGLACLRHYVLRFLLWRARSIPWNLPQFLDYAAERILLRQVGGGYIFVHRLLLEYFASLDETNK